MAKVKYWRINYKIPSGNLRVIGGDGKQLGVMEKEKAMELAKKDGLDLIEIAPKAKPPVAKIAEFGKFKYQEEKKAKQSKKGSKSAELKEVRLSPFIGDADYNVRLGRVKKFLAGGDKVRMVVKFKGRQMGSKAFGYNLLRRVLQDLDREINIDMEPKFVGRHLTMVASPKGKLKKKNDKNQAKDKKIDK